MDGGHHNIYNHKVMLSETAEVERVYEADLPKAVSNLSVLCEGPELAQPWQLAGASWKRVASTMYPQCCPWGGAALTQERLALS